MVCYDSIGAINTALWNTCVDQGYHCTLSNSYPPEGQIVNSKDFHSIPATVKGVCQEYCTCFVEQGSHSA
jgi:hypothetical protein